MVDFIMQDLNLAQKQAVEHFGSPLLIVAGAGTGKTTVLANKIAYLIKNKLAKPSEILAVTFTEKATTEMEERVSELVGEGVWDIWVSTFHGLGQRILEMHGLEIGLSNNFRLLNEIESWLLVRENLDKFDLDYFRPLGNPTKFIHDLTKHFGRCKDELIAPKDYLDLAESFGLDKDIPLDTSNEEELDQKRIAELANAYHTYNQILLDNNALDFADLIFYTVKLLRERPNILKHYQNRWKYILVDEFQDTNWAQYELIKLLTHGREEVVDLTVVGDDDQSIYKFRGASVSNILQFNEDFPQSRKIVLTENYRSGQKILDFAYNFIQLNNPDRLEDKLKIEKKLISQNKIESKVNFIYGEKSSDEAELVIKKIIEIKNNQPDLKWENFAILVRANNVVDQFIPVLLHAGIPYTTSVAQGLFRQKIVLDALAALRLVDNYHESTAVFRLLSCPVYDLAYEDLSKLTNICHCKAVSLFEAVKLGATSEIIISEEGKKKLIKFLADTQSIADFSAREPAIKVLYKFFESSGYLQWLTKNLETNQDQIGYLQSLFDYLEKFNEENVDNSVRGWLKYYNYLSEAGESGEEKSLSFGEGVRLLTVHAAKGLEFDYVFIPSFVEQRFPTNNRRDSLEIPEQLIREKSLPTGDAHLEEERRLFYVALTRAKKQVFISAAKNYGGVREKKLSRFLQELETANNHVWEKIPAKVLGNIDPVETTDNNNAVVVKQPEHFSFSQIAAYEKCPWQYRYQFILKVPTLGKGVFSFGRTLHTTLQKFYEQFKEQNNTTQTSLFSETNVLPISIVPSLQSLLEIYRQNWQDDWFYSREHKDAYREKGEKILKEFYQKNEKEGWVVPISLESAFRFRIGDYYFKGQIDRIDQTPNGVRLLDYKTGKPKTDLKFSDKLQLLIYQWAANRLGDDWQWGKIEELVYYYLDNNTEQRFLGKEKDLEKVEEEVIKIIQSICASNFTPNPDKESCAHCDFKEICNFRY